MKLFKKLMAVALAGAMVLTLFTGCAASVNKNELLKTLNDAKAYKEEYGIETIEAGDSTLAKNVASKAKDFIANHPDSVAEEAFYNAWNEEYDVAGIRSIVPKDTKDAYYLTFERLTKAQSEEYKAQPAAYVALHLEELIELNKLTDEQIAQLGDKATASITTQKIGDYEYLIVVLVQAAKAAK